MKQFLIKTIPHCLWLAYGQNAVDGRLMRGMYLRMRHEESLVHAARRGRKG